MTKEDVEDASGEGEQERWFGEKGCHESSKMEKGKIRIGLMMLTPFLYMSQTKTS